MATGDKLVNLDELKLVYDKLHVPSVQVQIPTGQWSGSSTKTYTVNATGVTADTIIDWAMDSSINYLTGDLTVTPGSGTITFSTSTLPSGTINVTLFFPGVNGEVVIQTLADVYSKSQTDTLLAAKVSTSNIVNNLTSTATDKPLSAAQGKTLEEHIQQSTANTQLSPSYDTSKIDSITAYRNGRIVFVSMQIAAGALPAGYSYIQCNLGVSFVAQPNIVFCSQGTSDDAKVFGGYFMSNTLQIRASASNSARLLATFVGITS